MCVSFRVGNAKVNGILPPVSSYSYPFQEDVGNCGTISHVLLIRRDVGSTLLKVRAYYGFPLRGEAKE